jgi:hypothetical protein
MIQAPAVLNIGGVGSGKTHALATLGEAGLDVFVIVTEPTGLETLLDVWKAKNLPIEKLHYKVIEPARAGFEGLEAAAKLISGVDFKFLTDQKPTNNRKEAKFISLLGACNRFVCDRDGKDYGSVATFGPDRAFVIDSLSGVNIMAMDLVVGDKFGPHVGEWGVAIKLLEKLFLNLTSNLKCTFVITGHLERETNEITMAQQIMASTLGKKLAPTLPRFFSEVVMSYREGDKFFWSTMATNVDLKARALPLSPKIEPSYAPILKRYQERLAFATSEGEKKTA